MNNIIITFKTPTENEVIFCFTPSTVAAYLGTQGHKITSIELVEYEKVNHNDLEPIATRVKGIYINKKFLDLKAALLHEIDQGGPSQFMQLAVMFYQDQMLN